MKDGLGNEIFGPRPCLRYTWVPEKDHSYQGSHPGWADALSGGLAVLAILGAISFTFLLGSALRSTAREVPLVFTGERVPDPARARAHRY
jgi:hypothetical protein